MRVVVDRVRVGVLGLLTALVEVGQQLQAEIGREHDRHDPRGDQGKADNPEDAAGIFAGARPGEADRQEAAAVTSVPVSIGNAVELQAKVAARARS